MNDQLNKKKKKKNIKELFKMTVKKSKFSSQ